MAGRDRCQLPAQAYVARRASGSSAGGSTWRARRQRARQRLRAAGSPRGSGPRRAAAQVPEELDRRRALECHQGDLRIVPAHRTKGARRHCAKPCRLGALRLAGPTPARCTTTLTRQPFPRPPPPYSRFLPPRVPATRPCARAQLAPHVVVRSHPRWRRRSPPMQPVRPVRHMPRPRTAWLRAAIAFDHHAAPLALVRRGDRRPARRPGDGLDPVSRPPAPQRGVDLGRAGVGIGREARGWCRSREGIEQRSRKLRPG